MGALVGLLLGLGLFMVWRSFTPPALRRPGRVTWRDKVSDLLAQAGVEAVTPSGLVASSAGVGGVVLALMYVVSRSPAIALAFALIASWGPFALVRFRARQRRSELRDLWPEVVDNLASVEAARSLAPPGAPLRAVVTTSDCCSGSSRKAPRTWLAVSRRIALCWRPPPQVWPDAARSASRRRSRPRLRTIR